MTIEHRVVRSDPGSGVEQADDYRNCFYACRYCNGSRGVAPLIDAIGRRLLDPCSTAWADHFVLVGDELRARPGDVDAEYTHGPAAYDLDAERKVLARRDRRERMEQALRALGEIPQKIARLEELLGRVRSADRTTLIDAMAELRQVRDGAIRELARYRAIPADKDSTCRCHGTDLDLPRFLAEQVRSQPIPEP